MTESPNESGHAGESQAVQFYKDEDALCRLVAGFLAEGFAQGDPAVLIATPAHRAEVESELRRRSMDIEALKRLGDFVVLDARETLDTFVVDGTLHEGPFKHMVGQVLAQAGRGRGDCTIRTYGEMINLLWSDGLTAQATRLETLWNDLANAHGLKLLCSYAMGNFYKIMASERLRSGAP